jgi:hypothetical protein
MITKGLCLCNIVNRERLSGVNKTNVEINEQEYWGKG